MLPPGHLAAGYIVSAAFLKIVNPSLPISDQRQLLGWGMFFSFAPDLDTFWVFLKLRRFIESDEIEHRNFYSHAPLAWFFAAALIFIFASFTHSLFFQIFGLLVWICSWTHFALDSIQHGIMWLWPWDSKLLALKNQPVKANLQAKKFFPYWLEFVRFYAVKMQLTFYLELSLIFILSILILNRIGI